MKMLFVRGMWGMQGPGLEENLAAIRRAGFEAVEMGAPADAADRARLRDGLQRVGLALVAQLGTMGDTPEDHARSFEEQYRRAAELSPLFVNSHTGRDIFTPDQNLRVFRAAASVQEELGVEVLHETHRGRALFSAPAAAAVLDAIPSLRLTADFSHWCCVHESLLEDQAETVRRAVEATGYIHARVGHAEGPQVAHPAAPEWREAVEAHLDWWRQIAECRRQRAAAVLAVCPEFGPVPYMPTLPWTRQPVADLWEINLYMVSVLKERLG